MDEPADVDTGVSRLKCLLDLVVEFGDDDDDDDELDEDVDDDRMVLDELVRFDLCVPKL